jgi:hypothetical protein
MEVGHQQSADDQFQKIYRKNEQSKMWTNVPPKKYFLLRTTTKATTVEWKMEQISAAAGSQQ